MAFPNFWYKRRCFLQPHTRCLANGDYNKCLMTAPGNGMFYVPDERPIYDEQECKYFMWIELWRGYVHQASWLLHDGEK